MATPKPDVTSLVFAEPVGDIAVGPQAYAYQNAAGDITMVAVEDRVVEPPDSKKAQAFRGGEVMVAAWWNWILRALFRAVRYQLERQIETDGDGVRLVPFPGSFTITAHDRTDATRFIHAVGLKLDDASAPVVNIVASNGLTIGTPTPVGDIPIGGAAADDIEAYSTGRGFKA